MGMVTKAVAAGVLGIAVAVTTLAGAPAAEAQQTVTIGSDRQTGGATANDVSTMHDILEGMRRLRR